MIVWFFAQVKQMQQSLDLEKGSEEEDEKTGGWQNT